MLKQAFLGAIFISTTMLGPLSAEELDQNNAPIAPGFASAAETPEIDRSFVFVPGESRLDVDRPTPTVLAGIATWLSKNFDLPEIEAKPRIELVPPATIAAIRYRGLMPQSPNAKSTDEAALDASRRTVAIYDDATQTIYLPEGWNGASPAEMSVLVHEMVHHIQNRGQLKYECAQEREKLAYAAQGRWLGLFGLTLSGEFELDPFTLLVRTRCMG